jgi:hypothetical protein
MAAWHYRVFHGGIRRTIPAGWNKTIGKGKIKKALSFLKVPLQINY